MNILKTYSAIPFAFMICIFAILGCVLTGCQQVDEATQQIVLNGSTMGTTYTIRVVPAETEIDPKELAEKIKVELTHINQAMSTYIEDSEISEFNKSRSTNWIPVAKTFLEVTKSAIQIHNETNSAFECTVKPLLQFWGFGPNRKIPKEIDVEQLKKVRSIVGTQFLKIQSSPPALKKSIPELEIDLSAIAKGDGVDRVAAVISTYNPKGYLVEIGGEIRVAGLKRDGSKWNLAIEKPVVDSRENYQIIKKTDCCVATSGDYRNFVLIDGKKYSHTIDPRTGYPISHQLASVTVFEKTCRKADALATSLMVLGPDEGYNWAQENNVAAMFLIYSDEDIVEKSTSLFEKETQAK